MRPVVVALATMATTGAEMPDGLSMGDAQNVGGLLATVGLGLLSWWNLRKGQRDTHEIAADAQDLQRERFDHERQREAAAEKDRVIATLREEASRLTIARDADAQRHDRAMDRIEARHTAERTACEQTTRRMQDDLLAAASALRSEIDAAAARDAAHRGEAHRQFDHDDET